MPEPHQPHQAKQPLAADRLLVARSAAAHLDTCGTPCPALMLVSACLVDVEGAEFEVLKHAHPRVFSVVMVETQGGSREKNKAVHELLLASGLEVSREFQVPSSSVFVQPGLQPAPATPNGRAPADTAVPAAMLLPGAQPGYCAATKARDAGDCNTGEKGAWRISRFRPLNVSGCLHRCRSECAQCRYVTVSLQAHDCSWYASCDLERLSYAGNGADHQSLAVL